MRRVNYSAIITSFAILSITRLSAEIAQDPIYSELWGKSGEKWTEPSRLPDFSHAGYHCGEKSLPVYPFANNVKDFGALGDGVADDTAAIQAAINATKAGAVLVPPGRYRVTDFIWIEKSGVVLRGAGADRSVLWFPKGLDEVHPRQGRTATGRRASGYSFRGAFINLRGDYLPKPLSRITRHAKRGDRRVEVADPGALKAGQKVWIVVHETEDQSLKTHLYSGDPGDIAKGKPRDAKLLCTVRSIARKSLELDRPLPFDAKLAWEPEIIAFQPTVTESGIESLGFDFPAIPYGGHFKESGFNAIELKQVYHCWVRDVVVRNGDLGINLTSVVGNTVSGARMIADPGRGIPDGEVEECTGHHAIQCERAIDNLITGFDIDASYVHDLSVQESTGNVFSKGRGSDLNLDHHKDTPYRNLFTDLDCGKGRRVWSSGGGPGLGRQCAGWGTFWNLRGTRPIPPPPGGWGPATINVIGLTTDFPSRTVSSSPWLEAMPPERLVPPDLHAAQLRRRTKE